MVRGRADDHLRNRALVAALEGGAQDALGARGLPLVDKRAKAWPPDARVVPGRGQGGMDGPLGPAADRVGEMAEGVDEGERAPVRLELPEGVPEADQDREGGVEAACAGGAVAGRHGGDGLCGLALGEERGRGLRDREEGAVAQAALEHEAGEAAVRLHHGPRRRRPDPEPAALLANGVGRHVDAAEGEAAAGGEVEAPVVPVAAQDAVLDVPLGQRVSHVGQRASKTRTAPSARTTTRWRPAAWALRGLLSGRAAALRARMKPSSAISAGRSGPTAIRTPPSLAGAAREQGDAGHPWNTSGTVPGQAGQRRPGPSASTGSGR